MKLSSPRRLVAIVVLLALTVGGFLWRSARETSAPLEPASGRSPSASFESKSTRDARLAASAGATSANRSSAAQATSARCPGGPARPLWLPLGDPQGAPLTMNPSRSLSRGTAGQTSGRSLRVKTAPATALAGLQPGESVILPLLEGKEATGRVNLVQADAGGWIRVAGELTGERKGTFALNAKAEDVDGILLLPSEGLALVISPQSDGTTAIVEKPIGEVLCIPMPKAVALNGDTSGEPPAVAQAAAIPILSSRPTATAVIYLDFDGETVTDPRWNGGQTIVAAAPNVTTNDINQIWAAVKEDYWAFNIDVTTDLNRYNNAPANRRTRCIVTPTDTAAPGSGGVAYINCFSRAGGSTFSATIPCWVFVGGAKAIGEAASHEVGHTLGLHHDGRTGEEYYAGHGSGAVGWAPIMGVGYYRQLVQWSRGEYPDASNTEDDIAIISAATNGFGFVADEAGDSRAAAAALNVNGTTIGQVGIISRNTDNDFYRVTVGAGSTLTLGATPATIAPDLDILLELQDANGAVLASANPDAALDATLAASLAPGTYYIRVAGTGRGSVSGDGYSNYGSIGAYNLSGSIVGAAQSPSVSGLANISAISGQTSAPVAFTVSDPDTVANLLTVSGTSSNPGLIPQSNLFFGGSGNSRTISVLPLAGQTGTATITVTVSDGALTGSGTFLVTVAAPATFPAFTVNPSSQTVTVGASVSFSVNATGSPSPTYQWFRNGSPIGGATSSTFTIAAASLGDAGNYTATASNVAGTATSGVATLVVNNGGGNGATLLTGTVIGSAPWYGLEIGNKFKAFDGDTNTSFDSEDGFIYVGLDFGATKSISRIRYFPRNGFAYRMPGGRICGANAPDLSDAVTLYTITSAPPEGVWQDVSIPASSGYRYVFFTTPRLGYGNVAELEFYGVDTGVPPPPPPPPNGGLLTGTVIGSSPWYGLAIGDKFKAFDGNTGTSFDSEDAFIYVGLDLGVTKSINRIRYFPRGGFAYRMPGGRICGANSPDLSDAVTLYTITAAPSEGMWQDVSIPATSGYRYVFFTTPLSGYGNVAELEFYGVDTSPPPPTAGGLLTGSVIGSSPWYGLEIGDKFKAFDGNTNTSFDSEDGFIFVGLDFGAPKSINRIRYFPRNGFAYRMPGARICGANSPDLSDAVTLYTVNSAPPEGAWQDVSIPATGGYRYVFFTTPLFGYGNVAELEFYGVGAP